jgi:hypothetical protein
LYRIMVSKRKGVGVLRDKNQNTRHNHQQQHHNHHSFNEDHLATKEKNANRQQQLLKRQVRLGPSLTITSLSAAGSSSLSARGSGGGSSNSSRWVLDETLKQELGQINIGSDINRSSNNRVNNRERAFGERSGGCSKSGLVGRILQPSGQYDGAPLSSFGAGGYRMQRPSNNGNNNVGKNDRFHHRSNFFQRQGSATIRSTTNNNNNSLLVDANRSSNRHQKNSRNPPPRGRLPSHGNVKSDRGGNNVLVAKEFQLPFLMGSISNSRGNNSNYNNSNGYNGNIYHGNSFGGNSNEPYSPVRVRTAGSDRRSANRGGRGHLPLLHSTGGSDFLSTAGLIAGQNGRQSNIGIGDNSRRRMR